jgi:hypothetical protein
LLTGFYVKQYGKPVADFAISLKLFLLLNSTIRNKRVFVNCSGQLISNKLFLEKNTSVRPSGYLLVLVMDRQISFSTNVFPPC